MTGEIELILRFSLGIHEITGLLLTYTGSTYTDYIVSDIIRNRLDDCICNINNLPADNELHDKLFALDLILLRKSS